MSGADDDHLLAARLAEDAGAALLELRARFDGGAHAVARWTLRDEADALGHDVVTEALRRLRPDDAVLSEEGADDLARLDAERVWIIDPLDGTREYGEPGRVDWAVHVALWSRAAGDLVAGAVALPARGLVLSTTCVPPLATDPPVRPRLLVSRSRPHPLVTDVIAPALDGELVPLGSAGAKAMAVVLGEAEVYAHAGGQYEWDSAAPAAVARAAGLHVSRLDGSPLRYNREDSYLPDLLVCRAELAGPVLAAVAEAGPAALERDSWRR